MDNTKYKMNSLSKLKFSRISDINKMISFYIFYNLFIIILSLSLISVVAFFHFQLDHDLSSIENWVQRNGWELIVTVKVLCFSAIYIILSTRKPIAKVSQLFENKIFKLADRNIWVIIVFLYFMIISMVKIKPNNHLVDISNVAISFVGTVLFFGIDILLIDHLKNFFELKNKKEIVKYYLFCTGVFLLTTYLSMPYSRQKIFLILAHFISLLIILDFKKAKFYNVFWYLVVFISPLEIFFGQDMLWQQQKSYFLAEYSAPLSSIFIIWLLSLSYIIFTRKNSEN